jgi:hypothetical protein
MMCSSAAHHVRDAHGEVVDHAREVVERNAVPTQEHEVLHLAVGDLDRSAHQIGPARAALLGRAKADHVGLAGITVATPAPRALEHEAFGLAALRHESGAGRLLVLGAGEAAVGVARSQQLVSERTVERESLGLTVRAERTVHVGPLVPGQSRPAHAVEDGGHSFGGVALLVRVFDAQDELAAVLARKKPAVQGRPDATDVQVASRRRRETRAYLGH